MPMMEAMKFIGDLQGSDELQKEFSTAMHETDTEMKTHIDAAIDAGKATMARNIAAFMKTKNYDIQEDELRFYLDMIISGLLNNVWDRAGDQIAEYMGKMGMSPDNFRRKEPEGE